MFISWCISCNRPQWVGKKTDSGAEQGLEESRKQQWQDVLRRQRISVYEQLKIETLLQDIKMPVFNLCCVAQPLPWFASTKQCAVTLVGFGGWCFRWNGISQSPIVEVIPTMLLEQPLTIIGMLVEIKPQSFCLHYWLKGPSILYSRCR